MSLGPLVLQRRVHAGVELHRAEVDVLVQLEPQPQQQALFQDARGDLRVADGAEVDGVERAQLGDLLVGDDGDGLAVRVAAAGQVGRR